MVFDRSNGIDWRTIAKVGGLACLAVFASTFIFWWGASLGTKSGYYGAQSQGYASQYPNDTDKRIEECFSNTDLVAAKQCAQEAITADRENQRGEHDLQAQREVADWTYYAVVVSILQIPLGVLGLIALVVTIRQGQDAIAKASDANKIAWDLGVAQASGYIELIEGSGYKTIPDSDMSGVLLRFKNIGGTPVIAMNVFGILYFGDRREPLGAAILRMQKNSRLAISRHGIGKGNVETYKLVFENKLSAQKMFAKFQEEKIFPGTFEFCAIYSDLFGNFWRQRGSFLVRYWKAGVAGADNIHFECEPFRNVIPRKVIKRT